jgi:hypothetical protein
VSPAVVTTEPDGVYAGGEARVDRGRRWGRQGAQGSVVKNQVAIFGQGYVGLSVGIAAAQAASTPIRRGWLLSRAGRPSFLGCSTRT